MSPHRRFAILLALALGLVAPAARGSNIVVNFNDLSYPGGPYDPNSTSPSGQAPVSGSYNNGWDLSPPGGFTSNGVFFSNSYNQTGYYWSGWAYSNVYDPTTTGPSPDPGDVNHQYGVITGTAPAGSGNYGIAFDGNANGAPDSFINLPHGTSPVSFQVTNTTFAYLAMTLGDNYATKFTTGSYFELKIFGYSGLNGTGTQVGEVDFNLAKYTSPSSLPVNVWSLVDLTPLAGSESLGFGFASSDVGPFGINTPLYFAMDNLTLSTPTPSVPEPPSVMLAGIAVGIIGLLAVLRRRRRRALR